MDFLGGPSMVRKDSETNTDLTCKGFDCFQDVIIFHTPVLAIHESTKDDPVEAAKWYAKYDKKLSYFPARSLAMLQPVRGKVLLPRMGAALQQIWEFYRDQCHFDEDQVIWYDYIKGQTLEYALMHDEIATAELRRLLAEGSNGRPLNQMYIFSNRPEITPWLEEMGFNVIYDTSEWRHKYGFKSILHPTVDSPTGKSFLEEITEFAMHPIRAPRGFQCNNTAELLKGAELMRAMGDHEDGPIRRVALKPVHGSDGDGIVFYDIDDIEGLSNYKFSLGDMLIEEMLDLDRLEDGSVMTVVTHYNGNRMLGPSCDQALVPGEESTGFLGNIYPCAVPYQLRKECEYMALEVMKASQPKGPGGFDFLFQHGKPYLVDINGGRFNGGMNPKAFHKTFAVSGTAYASFKHTPKMLLPDAWDVLKRENMAFICLARPTVDITTDSATDAAIEADTVGRVGIFPLVHLPGQFGSYVAIANTRAECLELQAKFLRMKL